MACTYIGRHFAIGWLLADVLKVGTSEGVYSPIRDGQSEECEALMKTNKVCCKQLLCPKPERNHVFW